MWKSKFYGAFVLNHRVVRYAIDTTPARWRGDAGSSPLDRARTAASSPRNDLVKSSPVHPPHWLIFTQVALLGSAYGGDEMVTLYFLATRCDASLAFFAVAWLATQLLQLPSALVRAYTVQSFVGASAAVWNGGNLASMAWNLRCSYGDNVAWGARNLNSTQVGRGRLGHPGQRLPESTGRVGRRLGRGGGRGHRRGPLGALQVVVGTRSLEPAEPADGAPRGARRPPAPRPLPVDACCCDC